MLFAVQVMADPSAVPGPAGALEQLAVLDTDVSNSTTTLADVGALSFLVTATTVYTFEWTAILRRAAVDTGVKLAFNGPANPTMLTFASRGPHDRSGALSHEPSHS
jgi:hypothetical protein